MAIDLKLKIKEFPKSPGVYQFLDGAGDILYVGKAKNLKNRIKSYFAKEIGRGLFIDQMVGNAKDLRYIETDSEIEAVLLEADLINKLKPKYNSRLKDDKSFLAIKIARNQNQNAKCKSQNNGSYSVVEQFEFPGVELVRYKNIDPKDKTAEYFGPYPAGELLKKSLRYLRKVFPYRDCSKTKWKAQARKERPCIYCDLRICTGPCVGKTTAEEYAKNIQYLKSFLRGKKAVVIKQLEQEMKKLSHHKKYEEASLIRDKLVALRQIKNVSVGLRDDVFSGFSALFNRIECYDISNIGEEYVVGSMVVFTKGKADKSEYRKFKVKMQNANLNMTDQNVKIAQSAPMSFRPVAGEPESMQTGSGSRVEPGMTNDLARLKQVLERRFKNDWASPDLVVIDGGETHLKVAVEVMKKYDIDKPVMSVSKGPKRDKNDFHFGDGNIAKYVKNNQELQNVIIASRDEAHRFAISYYRKLHAKGMLEK